MPEFHSKHRPKPVGFFDRPLRRRIVGLAFLSFSVVASAGVWAAQGDPPAPKAPPKSAANTAAAAAASAKAASESALKDAIDKVDHGRVDDKVIAIIKAGAEGGSGPAAQRLGYLYVSGLGMEVNYPQAYHWYCVAALRNVPFAVDTAFKIFNRMTPAARMYAENIVSTALTPAEIARLIAMRPANVSPQGAEPGSDGGSMDGASK